MVPTGTLSTMSSPSRPVLFEPSPCRPRSAVCSGLKRKCTSVLCRSLDSMTTSPPLPPSPPEGPPRGTNFSRRNAMQPFPPSPAFTLIFASSMNMNVQLSNGKTSARQQQGNASGQSADRKTDGPDLALDITDRRLFEIYRAECCAAARRLVCSSAGDDHRSLLHHGWSCRDDRIN